jgi:alkylhydroperoxidase family enzyme
VAHIELGNENPGIRGLLAYRPETAEPIMHLVEQTLAGPACDAPVSGKMRALLDIAGLVRIDGRLVSEEAVAKARAEGATDIEIHDTVLITATFCMFNRYVDGLAAPVPDDPMRYQISAAHLVKHGYQVLR